MILCVRRFHFWNVWTYASRNKKGKGGKRGGYESDLCVSGVQLACYLCRQRCLGTAKLEETPETK